MIGTGVVEACAVCGAVCLVVGLVVGYAIGRLRR